MLPEIWEVIIVSIWNFTLYGIAVFLIINKTYSLIGKFGLFSFAMMLLNYVTYRIGLVLFPLICLLFVLHVNKRTDIKEFFKENRYIMLGLLSIFGIYIFPHENKYNYPYFEGITLAFLVFVILITSSVIYIYKYKDKADKISKKEMESRE
ncbi:MAG: hypothetical protein GF353_03140 [Candidatus Lokiarchaeota archaeon]|nr:hypothetical protein [Candidatus Lokiarchaeota archaeon]